MKLVISKEQINDRFLISLFVFCVLFLSEFFLSAADNYVPGLILIRMGLVCVGYLFAIKGRKISYIHIIYMIFSGWVIFIAFINNNLSDPSTFYLIRYMSLGMTLDYCLKRYSVRSVSNSMFSAYLFCMILNFLVNPRDFGFFSDVKEVTTGYYGRTIWFTGSRNTFGEFFLVSTLILLIAKENEKKRKYLAFIWGICGLILSIYVWSSSSIVVIVLMLVGLVFNKLYKLTIAQSVLLGILVNFSVVILRVQNLLKPIVVDILHRDLTFTGRTAIWDFYLHQLKEYWLFGCGEYMKYIPFVHREFTPHNAILSVLVTYGLIGVLFFVAIFCLALRYERQYRNLWCKETISVFLFLYFLRCMIENDYSAIFVFITIIHNIPQIYDYK